MIQLINFKNKPVLLNPENFQYLSQAQLQEVQSDLFAKGLIKAGLELVFWLTEPCPVTYVPKISEGKLGTVNFFDDKSKSLTIELRDDFKNKDKKSDEVLKEIFSDKYFGEGVYQLTFADLIQGAWFKVEEKEKAQIL
jgi:hypothetical protein